MKALFNLKSVLNQSSTVGILALILLTPVIFPKLAFAAEQQTLDNTALVFKIKDQSPQVAVQTPKPNTQNSIDIKTIEDSDPLVISLKQYLEDNDSPLGEYAAEMVQQRQWQRALAISYVESHMGRDCFDNNCSGIGVKPGHPSWRKYKTKLDWFIDLNNLLEKPIYKERFTTFKQMKGVYVQPGSSAWVNGAQKKYDDLIAITAQAEIDRQELAQLHTQTITALATFPETAN